MLRSAQLLCPRQLFSSARHGVIGARPQLDEYVLDVAHDVRIGTERRHDALLSGVYVLAPVDDNVREVGIVHRLQDVTERRGVTRSFAVGTMTHGNPSDSGGNPE